MSNSKRKYFVSYVSSASGDWQPGHAEVVWERPITGINAIVTIETLIENHSPALGMVLVTGWQPFDLPCRPKRRHK